MLQWGNSRGVVRGWLPGLEPRMSAEKPRMVKRGGVGIINRENKSGKPLAVPELNKEGALVQSSLHAACLGHA